MHKFNQVLCQTLLDQTRSIDDTARLMRENESDTKGFYYWRRQIIKHVEKGDLKI
ncbi:hypothetical protein VPHK394_0019 [Vibrio phage K394]